MKIYKIENNFNINNRNNPRRTIKQNNSTNNISFCSGNQKESGNLINEVKYVLKIGHMPELMCITPRKNQPALSSQENKSEIIKLTIKAAIKSAKGLSGLGKNFEREIKYLLKQGKNVNYKSNIPYGNKTVSFGFINEKTGIPDSISTWEKGKYLSTYEIAEVSPELKYTYTYTKDGAKNKYECVNGKVKSAQIIDYNNQNITRIINESHGFYLFNSILNKDEPERNMIRTIIFDYKDYKNCNYYEGIGNILTSYKYNPDIDLWEDRGVFLDKF